MNLKIFLAEHLGNDVAGDMLHTQFIRAYQHGIVILCCSSIRRCFYLGIFSYSADYPKKFVLLFSWAIYWHHIHFTRILIVSICTIGTCPCPWCTIPMAGVPNMGSQQDMLQQQMLACAENQSDKDLVAQSLIYKKTYAINSQHIEALLKEESLRPILVSVDSSRAWHIHVVLIECLLRETVYFQSQHLCYACSWSPIWIQAWGLEGYFGAYFTHAW